MEESILVSTKNSCGIASDYTAFDEDILMFINGAFSTLTQLGVGPTIGFTVDDSTVSWADYVVPNQQMLNMVKVYVHLRARYLFDPPSTSFHLTAMKEQIADHEWRLNEFREELTP